MSSHTTSKIFVIGGTGAQGLPIIRALVQDKKYLVRALSRDATSRRAKAIIELGNVTILEGTFADEDTLRAGFRGCDGAYINIDGFNTGEKTELFWAIRAYEIAIEEGIKFFVYGNLDYALKKAHYESKFRAGHYDGKGRIGEWILFQNQANSDRMGAAVFTTGPYMEMAISAMTPMSPSVEQGTVIWRVPLGEGMNLEVAIADIKYHELAAAFEKVTGHPARYIDVDLETYWNGPLKMVASLPAGYNADPNHGLLEHLEARCDSEGLRVVG
jgi:hypothetical protein